MVYAAYTLKRPLAEPQFLQCSLSCSFVGGDSQLLWGTMFHNQFDSEPSGRIHHTLSMQWEPSSEVKPQLA